MLVFDILIVTLVLIPWLGEDVTYRIGQSYLELPDLGVPLLAIALVGVAVHRWPRDSAALARSALGAIRSMPARAAGAALGALAALVLLVLLWPRLAFEYPGLDVSTFVWRLTHGTTAILFVSLVGVAVRRWTGEPWEGSFIVRQALRPGRAWLAVVRRAPAWALWSGAAAVGSGYLAVALVRHWAFESHGWDLAIFTNVMWNLTHGHGYVSSLKGGINLFADHQSPLFWVLAPLFRVAPRPETLLFAQAFGLAAGGPALYYLARHRFGSGHWATAAMPWLYWSYLPLRNANAFDFHPEVFMLPLFLWAFVGFGSERRGARVLGLLALVAALAAKESASVVAVGIGLAWALSSGGRSWRGRWPGIALALAGVAIFLFDVKIVPRLFGDDYAYLGLYGRFGGGVGDVLLAPFTQPAFFFSQLIDRARLNFLFWTLAPLAFLPFFAWRAALAALPPYLMLFLSEGDQRVRLVFHYGIEPGTALFWALPFGLAAFARRFGWKAAGTWTLVWALACHGSSELTRARSYDRYLQADWLATQALPCLDPEASMAASDSLTPHLATRQWISYPDQLREQPSGRPVSCVVTDLTLDNWPLGREGASRVLAGLPAQGYRKAWQCNEFTVYERGGAACLRCTPQCY